MHQSIKWNDKKTTEEALIQIKEREEELFSSTLVYNENWHPGVLGIVASRLIEKYYRPTIVLTKSNEYYIGSARSIKGFDIYDALKQCNRLLDKFGGHKYAAGLKLHESNIELFRNEFEKFTNKNISENQKIKTCIYDLELSLSDLNIKFLKIIKQMGPFGPNNLEPIFFTRNCTSTSQTRSVGNEKKHLQLYLRSKNKTYKGIAFGRGHLVDQIKKSEGLDIYYSLEENTWNGNIKLELVIKDLIVKQ